jgi:hypothetical protein
MDQDYAKAISAFEQAGAHLGQFAAMLQTYHKSLCEAGFQRTEALELVRELQTTLFAAAFNFGPTASQDDE